MLRLPDERSELFSVEVTAEKRALLGEGRSNLRSQTLGCTTKTIGALYLLEFSLSRDLSDNAMVDQFAELFVQIEVELHADEPPRGIVVKHLIAGGRLTDPSMLLPPL